MIADPTAFPIQFDPLLQRMRGVTRLGNIAFDVPFISQIEGNLWQGGADKQLVLPPHFQHVISLAPQFGYQLRHELKSIAINWLLDDDREGPPAIVEAIADWVAYCVADGPTLVHCQAGLNRSSLITGRVLMKGGRSAQAAIDLIREKRSPACLSNLVFESYLRTHE